MRKGKLEGETKRGRGAWSEAELPLFLFGCPPRTRAPRPVKGSVEVRIQHNKVAE